MQGDVRRARVQRPRSSSPRLTAKWVQNDAVEFDQAAEWTSVVAKIYFATILLHEVADDCVWLVFSGIRWSFKRGHLGKESVYLNVSE